MHEILFRTNFFLIRFTEYAEILLFLEAMSGERSNNDRADRYSRRYFARTFKRDVKWISINYCYANAESKFRSVYC